MPINKDFARRIEILDECLRRRQKRWYIDDLLDAVNSKLSDRFDKKITKRTLYSDLDFLENEKGAPIVKKWEGQRKYYQYSDSSYSVLNLPFDDEELGKLRDVIQMLRGVNDFNLLDDIESMVSRLENRMATNTGGNRSMIQFERHTNADGAKYIDDIFTAVQTKSVLKIKYLPFGVIEPYDWNVHPYLLKEYRNRWFLIGRVDGLTKVTNIALDRILKIKNSSVEFVENDLFDADTFYNNVIGVSLPEGEQVQDIVLKISGGQVNYVLTKPIHHTQEIVNKPDDNTLVIRLRLISNYELQSVLLSYTPDVEVIEPKMLRLLLLEKYKTAYKQYKR